MIKRFEQFINESTDNQEFKEYFLSLINGCSIEWKDNVDIWWKKENNWFILYENGFFYYSYDTVLPKIKLRFDYSTNKINELLTPILKQRFNCEVFKTSGMF